MKSIALLIFAICATAFAQPTSPINNARITGTSLASSSSASSLLGPVSTIAALESLVVTSLTTNTSVNVLGYYAANDGGGGSFTFTTSSSATVDHGLICSTPSGGTTRWIRNYSGFVHTKWLGAYGDNSHDDTIVLQHVLDTFQYVYFDAANYKATQLTISKGGQIILGNYSAINGSAVVPTQSIVQLKGIATVLYDLTINGNQSTNYTCGMHWYTNNTNLYIPEFERLYNILITSCQIGLVVGAIPSQVSIPAQGTANADGIASNAPISESTLSGLYLQNCPIGFYMRQPNGKIALISPVLAGESSQWTGQAGNTCALTIADPGSSLAVQAGSLEQVQDSTGALAKITDGEVVFDGTTIESIAPTYLAATGRVRFSKCQDFGFNMPTAFNPFQINSSATGSLQFISCKVTMPPTWLTTGTRSLIKSVGSFNGSFATNLSFQVDVTDSEMADCPFITAASFVPFAQGVRVVFSNTWISSYDSGATRVASYRINPTTDFSIGYTDKSASQLASFPQTSTTTGGGYSFTAGTGAQWGAQTSGLPSVDGLPLNAAIEVNAPSSGQMDAVSGVFPINPGVPLIVSGFLKTGTSSNFAIIRLNYFKYDGTTAASTASQNVIQSAESNYGSTWQPLIALMAPPKDAQKAQIQLNAQPGAQVQTLNLEVK